MNFQIINDKERKKILARNILEALPDWFGIEEAREQYIMESAQQICFGAYDEEEAVGFLCLKETGNATVELAVMGVRKEYHHRGIGRELFMLAKKTAYEKGYAFMQVKTVKMGVYEDYDRTNLFYLSMGFKEFEVLPTLWDEWNPCQIYVMSLENKLDRG